MPTLNERFIHLPPVAGGNGVLPMIGNVTSSH
jgi:hypothetical protein